MNPFGRVAGLAAGAVGVVAVGAVAGFARQRHLIAGRPASTTADVPLGSLHSSPITVVADDGVPLVAEVDELSTADPDALSVVFVHGYALTMDCWHFQRVAYRGLVRAVYYDQRSHGRSGRSSKERATIDQLGLDLASVIDSLAPDGPVVLVGHSMGGMSIVALAEQRPELFGDRVVGVALLSTTAGGLDPSRLLVPFVPARIGAELMGRVVSTLAVGHRAVDGVRRAGRGVAQVATDLFAFGDAVPQSYVDFVDEMLSSTPFAVVAEFFPSFRTLDKFDAVEVMSRVPTTVLCGTADRLTSIGHSRKLHARIAGSTLIECDGAGHMVMMERHGQVDAALDQLLSAAAQHGGVR